MRKGRRTGNRKRLGRNTRYRRDDAEDRAAVREERGWTGQLAELDRRLGKGVGAKRERERLEFDRVLARSMAAARPVAAPFGGKAGAACR